MLHKMVLTGRVPRIARALAWIAMLGAAGCSAIRFEEEPEEPGRVVPVAQLAGAWPGALEVEGQDIRGTLVLEQNGANLSARFSAAELGGESAGTGVVGTDGSVRLTLRYRTQCDGTLELTGAVLDQARRLAGSLTADDCTGRAAGAFSFLRR